MSIVIEAAGEPAAGVPAAGAPAVIRLDGMVGIDDVEPLLEALRRHPGATVELGAARHLHAAIVQILLRQRPTLAAGAGDPFVAMLLPLLGAGVGSTHIEGGRQ